MRRFRKIKGSAQRLRKEDADASENSTNICAIPQPRCLIGDGVLICIMRSLCEKLESLKFTHSDIIVYNPLHYAGRSAAMYLKRYGELNGKPGRVLFVGMNPGPWGMVQTGIPFGDVGFVRDWMGIDTPVGQPKVLHPKRQVMGFSINRGEQSGKRFWGLMEETCHTAQCFFSRAFVYNYCPLAFFKGPKGTNLTPDKLRSKDSKPLFEACDGALRSIIFELQPSFVVGVGNFAHKRIQATISGIVSKKMDSTEQRTEGKRTKGRRRSALNATHENKLKSASRRKTGQTINKFKSKKKTVRVEFLDESRTRATNPREEPAGW
eukprot:CAMPEP_0114538514 /NCGR_PEP_ID=MMETSP0109-20121206/30186_1 /TAXON_ID=29199 /ORGANISM="Chlorarachnion reptans, Strain CCCM449" /LENGTH=321 /DNA_ID=CAMNT_0001722543 /DNA_START=43 /DNA_END=1005 /DNA_ORIENTATION=+